MHETGACNNLLGSVGFGVNRVHVFCQYNTQKGLVNRVIFFFAETSSFLELLENYNLQ